MGSLCGLLTLSLLAVLVALIICQTSRRRKIKVGQESRAGQAKSQATTVDSNQFNDHVIPEEDGNLRDQSVRRKAWPWRLWLTPKGPVTAAGVETARSRQGTQSEIQEAVPEHWYRLFVTHGRKVSETDLAEKSISPTKLVKKNMRGKELQGPELRELVPIMPPASGPRMARDNNTETMPQGRLLITDVDASNLGSLQEPILARIGSGPTGPRNGRSGARVVSAGRQQDSLVNVSRRLGETSKRVNRRNRVVGLSPWQ